MILNKKTKIPIVAFALVSMLASYIVPLKTEAQVELIGKSLVCTVGGVLAPLITDSIFSSLRRLYENLPQRLSDFLGLTNFINRVLFPPDVPTSVARLERKEHAGDIVARCVAMALFDKISKQTIAGVRTSGRNNNRNKHDPAFVRHWRNFRLQAQRRGENIFRSVLGSTEICPYFKGDLYAIYNADQQSNVRNYTNTRVGNLDPFHRRAQCTMPRGWNPKEFERNFVPNGGWGALVKLSEPQNNFYGALIMSSYELAAQRLLEEESDQAEAISGSGFTSRRGKDEIDGCALRRGITCIVYKDILTPGSYIQQSAAALVQQELAWITNTDEIGELIGDLTIRLFSRILDLSGDPKRKSSVVIGGKPPIEDGPVIEPPDSDTEIPPTPIPPIPECSNDRDDDNDQLTDYPDDPGCFGFDDPTEAGGNLPPPDGLPDNTAAIQICDSVGTTCLTAQWWKAGKAGSIGLNQCQTSHCVVLNHQIRDGSNDADIFRGGTGTVIASLFGAPDYPNGTRTDTCMRDGNTKYELATNAPTSITLSLVIPAGGAGSCASPTPQCSDGIDNADKDGRADFGGAGGLPPDPDCDSPADNDESFSGGRSSPQCNDGIDNDFDTGQPGGGTDYPTDTDCTSITDELEGPYSVVLCANLRQGPPCEIFTGSSANLVSSIVGDNNAESVELLGGPVVSAPIIELCLDPDFGLCTALDNRNFSGGILDSLSSIPTIGNNTVSSIRIRPR